MTGMSTARVPEYNGEWVPELQNGDRLTREEFERRYEAMPWLKKAELVEGVVYMGSPVSRDHAKSHIILATWLGTYLARHPDLEGGDNGTIRLDVDNEFQPDLLLRRVETGTSTGDTFGEGPPELVVEIAISSVSLDTHAKRNVYRRAGVGEYIIWRVKDEELDWLVLEHGAYSAITPGADGIIESRQFPGLRLDVRALLAGDLMNVLAALSNDYQNEIDPPACVAKVGALSANANSRGGRCRNR